MSEQPSPEELEVRIDMAFTLLLHGFSQREAVTYLAEKTTWGAALTKRTLRNYCYAAREELARMATADIDRREEYSKAVYRLTNQYKKANALNDPARAIAAVNSMSNLMHLDTPDAQTWESDMGIESGLTPAVKDAGAKMLELAAQAPDKFSQLREVIETLYVQLQLAE